MSQNNNAFPPSPRPVTKEDFHNIFFRIGYDISDGDDIRRLADDLKWVADRRAAESKSSAGRKQAFWVVLAALIGPTLTVSIQWTIDHLKGGH